MKVVVAGEYRLVAGPDGRHYADGVFGHDFWSRYLNVFSSVAVVGRVRRSDDVAGLARVDGQNVEVWPLPHYDGAKGFVRALPEMRRRARQIGARNAAIIARMPGPVGAAVINSAPRGKPFGVEVVGDPYDVFAPGVVGHPLRPLLRQKAAGDLRRACGRASVCAYVSPVQLPDRYPPAAGAEVAFYSSATMPKEAFAEMPRNHSRPLRNLISIGSMAQIYKGFDILLRAFVTIRRATPDACLTIVGDGQYLGDLMVLARELGIEEAVTFTGAVSRLRVRELLDSADLYVSSSRTEGLPRVIIEATARGLPAVGTNVGSSSEILAPHAMCPPNDASALAVLCLSVMNNWKMANELAAQGWRAAHRYEVTTLQRERDRLFAALQRLTDEWRTNDG